MISTMAVMGWLCYLPAPRHVAARRFYRIARATKRPPCWRHSVAHAWPVGYVAREETHMSYVQSVLQSGEEIRHTAKIHWIKYVPGLIVLVAAVVILLVGEFFDRAIYFYFWLPTAGIFAAVSAILLIRAWWVRWNTEIAITNRRIIFKEGFISRNTVEMHMDKVESVDVDQSVLGRILGYGNVIVKGTGTGFEPLKTIAAPLDLRNHITGI
jgi:membrane protein YdbS with pleckstrin-like domain